MSKIEEFLEWFRDEDNLTNLRTASTGLFIIIFVLYFYGFRTGFQPTINDIGDAIIDMAIVLISAFAIINDFSMRGVQTELHDENNKGLKEGIKEHEELTKNLDEDKAQDALIYWNREQDKKEMTRKKEQKIKKLKRKQRKYPKDKRKYKKLQKKIDWYSCPETHVKIKRKHVVVDDLLKRGAIKKEDKEVGVTYSPHRDTLSSQSGMVLAMVLFTSFMRLALDPTFDAFLQALLFLSWLIPFLIIRAILSYQISRNNTKYNYPVSLNKQIKIIKWCNNYKPKKEEVAE